MVSAGNVATAGIFTLLAVLLVLQTTREPRTAVPPSPPAASASDRIQSSPPMRAVILPPPPEFRGTPRGQVSASAPASAPAKPPAVAQAPVAAPKPRPPAPVPAPPIAAPPTPAPPPPALQASAPPTATLAAPARSLAPPSPAPPSPAMVRIDPAQSSGVLAEGRVALRLLEHGRGPAIEIAWPTDDAGLGNLYRLLQQCYGMRVALLDADGRLFSGGAVDLDRFSGFVREPQGATPSEEASQVAALRERYPGAGSMRAVRVFPREVDAGLIGGLRQLLGTRYDSAQTIRAAYRSAGSELVIEDIVVDGAAASGRIFLVPNHEESCPQGS